MILVIFVAVILLLSGGFGGIGMALSNASNGMSISSIVAYALGGIACWGILAGGIYFAIKSMQPHWEQAKNRDNLLDDLYNYAYSDDYICICIEFNRGLTATYSALYYSLGHGGSWYNFNQHGYSGTNYSQILDFLRTLERRLNGYLKIHYEEICGYDPSITVTHGTMPGGGDGYYVSTGGYDTANVPRAAYLYLGENAKKHRQADRDRATKSKLRKI